MTMIQMETAAEFWKTMALNLDQGGSIAIGKNP